MSKLIAATLVLGLLAAALVVPLQHADAFQKADTSSKLKPKSYGAKTSYKMCNESSCHKQFKILLTSNMSDSKKLVPSQKYTR